MNLFFDLPADIQDIIYKKVAQLFYNEVVEHFNKVCVSIDARLLAHKIIGRERFRSSTTVFCNTYDRVHTPNLYNYRGFTTRPEEYTERLITYTLNWFGGHNIDNIIAQRGAGLHRQHNDPSELPLPCVLQMLTQHAEVTINNLQQLLTINNVKFKKSLRKPELVRLFLQL